MSFVYFLVLDQRPFCPGVVRLPASSSLFSSSDVRSDGVTRQINCACVVLGLLLDLFVVSWRGDWWLWGYLRVAEINLSNGTLSSNAYLSSIILGATAQSKLGQKYAYNLRNVPSDAAGLRKVLGFVPHI